MNECERLCVHGCCFSSIYTQGAPAAREWNSHFLLSDSNFQNQEDFILTEYIRGEPVEFEIGTVVCGSTFPPLDFIQRYTHSDSKETAKLSKMTSGHTSLIVNSEG